MLTRLDRPLFSMLGTATAVGMLFSQTTHAFPVNPNKVPVDKVISSQFEKDFVLAFDSSDQSIVYYAPKTGRTATLNGQPLVGFSKLGDGRALLNVQMEYGVFGNERSKLLTAIQAAGYTARPWPYLRTEVRPLAPGINPDTGKVECREYVDESTGEKVKDCEHTPFDELVFVKGGPSLGENIAVTALLNPIGATVYENLLRSGNAIQMALNAEYYTAGDAFTAVITVNWEKVLKSFNAYAAYHNGYCTDVQIETYWKREGLCYGRPAEDCAVRVDLTDGRGRKINNVTLDPEDPDQKILWQAIDRIRQKFVDEMLTPMNAEVQRANTSAPSFGYKLDVRAEDHVKQMHAQIEIRSPRGVNKERTTIVSSVGCLTVSKKGAVNRTFDGDCQGYWDGTIRFEDVKKRTR